MTKVKPSCTSIATHRDSRPGLRRATGEAAHERRISPSARRHAVVSDSERQAVQLALLVLLASVFFSGFVIDTQQFTPAVQAVGNLLPVTHGIRLLQDLMLRGTTTELWRPAVLLVMTLVTVATTWVLLRRGLSAQA